jgi:hypothetical protein
VSGFSVLGIYSLGRAYGARCIEADWARKNAYEQKENNNFSSVRNKILAMQPAASGFTD